MKLVPRIVRTAYYRLRREGVELHPWADLAQHPEIRGGSLAIVGNAGYLAQLDQGNRIDDHDLVLRMNNFRTQGFERQVGTRCDIFCSAFYHDVDLARAEVRRPKIIVASIPANFRKLPASRIHTRGGEWITAGLLTLGRRVAYVPDEVEFAGYIRRIGRYPTTGAAAIILALEHLLPVYTHIYITGFSFFDGPSHYYCAQQIVPRNHDLPGERMLLRELLMPAMVRGRVTLDPIMHLHLFGDGGENAERDVA